MAFTIRVNDVSHDVDVDGDTPLLWVWRDVLGLTGTKFGCTRTGWLAVDMRSLHRAPIDSITSEITTIEAIGKTAVGARLQKAWLDREVVQCGYCQSGQIMSASALLASKPNPTEADIDDAVQYARALLAGFWLFRPPRAARLVDPDDQPLHLLNCTFNCSARLADLNLI
jgi:isoquinoline 1-oxidoreductase subunit alpha